MLITYDTCEASIPAIDQKRLSEWINRVVVNNSFEIGEINYYFCSDNYLLEMNREHLNHDYFTDIITFDYTVADIVSGDLFISVDTVLDNAKEYGCEYLQELHRVMIHGVLHLMGIDDKTDEDQEIMTQKEDESLALLSDID
ncbi:rRNA maturation RNase YbeY [Labilibaculum sp. A4]|uniref:Endoribonuclease YbeY n=1 Tax=Labilibaculum euxinus TaxID=2686357 RepID=A0A425Y9N5_9BACT|nr:MULTISPECIES: rRNA maturation RNase YbeY [Labilibaculum]MDQ1772962.1 rRNA maturation RNase YbeY [Labilibaculum euxinus]MUP36901.1 rRNA maturation RNase YbeY [Labilibaculum euxinus]MVB06106.1 rRNA maturation RNase YbeY [Labilibaculum euxinus]MWN77226.1 rRNA maturation RNase YbeY [Labilibaculum euxinus]